ncbi:hypothetical protein MMC22_006687 [Lobaria immixta]|nr:hypothetical protein [Lobaria immixta]
MGNEIILIVIFTVLALGVGFAWVGGYLDKYQSKAQEKALDAMGENKASYGLKGTLKGQRIGSDENINNLQDNVGDQAGGLVGKGGIGESIGGALSKGL